MDRTISHSSISPLASCCLLSILQLITENVLIKWCKGHFKAQHASYKFS